MTDAQQRAAAKAFAKNWKDRGYEKGDSQIFWVELLTMVFGVTEISQFISFEDQVHLDHTSFIDGYIEKTHVMIEQKSINKSLTAAIRQSDGSMLTPFEQAKRYSSELPYSKRPRWIVTSNFQSFYIYDMEKPGGDPEIIQLENLEKEYYRLQFLVDEGNKNLQREMEVSIAAGEIVGLLYDALAKQYADPTTERAMKSLNILCVRMVFCLYAEDAGIFGQHGMFHDYLEEFDARKMRKAMIELFQILDTKPEDRDPYLKDDNLQLAVFPYVNGGLFANEDIEIPPFTDEIRNLLLEKRVKNVREFRLSCPSPDTNHYADKPTFPVRLRYYSEDRINPALALPKVSSQNRRYIPMEVIDADVIAGSKLFLIPDISLYHFGVLTSNVHMAWMRTVCGRLKSDYSYASNVVYNTFPWPEPTAQ